MQDYDHLIAIGVGRDLLPEELEEGRQQLAAQLNHTWQARDEDGSSLQIICLKFGKKESWLGVDVRHAENPQIWYADTNFQAPVTIKRVINHFLTDTCNVKEVAEHFHDVDAQERLDKSLGVHNPVNNEKNPLERIKDSVSAYMAKHMVEESTSDKKNWISGFGMFKTNPPEKGSQDKELADKAENKHENKHP